MEILKQIADGLERGEEDEVARMVEAALEAGLPAGEVLRSGLLAGMGVVGERFRVREIFLPDVLLAARAMYAGMDLLKPHLAKGGVPVLGKVVLGTIRGDLHDIGKNLVGIMLEGAGFAVVDLGHDVAPERFVDTAVAEDARVVGMSALLTTTMTGMRDVVELVRTRGLDGRLKTIVGGAPLSAKFAREIGADAYAFDAASAVTRIKVLVGAA